LNKFKRWKLRRDFTRAARILRALNKTLADKNMPRAQRRQFWRDFYASPARREVIIDDLVKSLGRRRRKPKRPKAIPSAASKA